MCTTCKQILDEKSFYTSNDKEKYPDGRVNECKKCMTRHLDNWDKSTYLWILAEVDVPYIEEEWNKIMEAHADKPEKLVSSVILGKYISKMKLSQYKKFRFADSDRIHDEKIVEQIRVLKEQGLAQHEIDAELQKVVSKVPEKPEIAEINKETGELKPIQTQNEEDYDLDVTDDEWKMLRIKWGATYSHLSLIRLEQLYQDIEESYEIKTGSDVDYLKLICKASMSAHDLIDTGDYDTFQKVSRTYDALMKSSKLQAVQNKKANEDQIDSVGELFKLAEEKGFIPEYYIEKPEDCVDATLNDLRSYVYKLVTKEMNLGNLIENALMKMQKSIEEANEKDDGSSIDEMAEMEQEVLQDADYQEYNEFLESQEEE